jgi:hypothetical protein
LSQIPTTQDCLGAVPVCAQVYSESTAPSGLGNYSNEIDPSITCVFDDNNSIWYTFTVNSSGNFGFVLTPNDLNDDYDWALFNLTNSTCDNISKIPQLLVSCNAAGGGSCQGVTGANGNSRYDNQGGGCEADFPDSNMGQSPFNDFIPVLEGNSYTLMVSNWTGSTNGYEIDFGVSEDIGIIDRTPPEINAVTLDRIDGCSPMEITLEFTEFIQCNSIDLSNFQLIDSEGERYDIMFLSPICEVGGEYSRTFLITLMEPLTKIMETYTLLGEVQDGYKILDVCDNEGLAFSSSFEVTLPLIGDILLPADTVICDLPNIVLNVSDPTALAYAWQDGTTSPYITISSSGTYIVTVSNTCEVKEAVIEVEFISSANETVDLGPDRSLCDGTSYTLDPNLNINYRYEWNDGNMESIRNISTSGTYRVSVSNECRVLGEDEITVEFEERSFSVDLGEAALLCTGERITLSAGHPYAVDFLWSDGSTAPTLSVIAGGQYAVTVSNECGSIIDEVTINESSCVECHVYIPNTMAPNSGSSNNELKVTSNCRLESYRIRVYDRWGTEVFLSDDPAISWKGFDSSISQIGSGIYVFVVRYSYFEFAELVENVEFGDILVIH